MALTQAELDAAQAQINAARDQAHTNIDLAKGWAEVAETAAGASGAASAQTATAEANRAGQQKALAETARTGAETARTGAETARTGAETARTGAETARTGAETARDVVLSSLDTKADLVDGKLDQAQLPDLAITQFLGEKASQSEMLTLAGQRGDWCVRTDLGTAWILVSEPASAIGSWRQLTSPESPVQSVAGKTGAVTLAKVDVGLGNVDNTSDAAKPVSTAMQAALTPLQNRVDYAPATWYWDGTSLPTSAAQVHAQARVGDFIVAPNLTTDPGWHQITGV